MHDNQRPVGETVARIIEPFLYAHPRPTTANWKELIEANPTLAEEIADAALWHGRTKHVDQAAFAEPLDEVLFNATKSGLLSAMYTSTAPVEKAKVSLQQCKGPMARSFAQDIGLGQRVDLFNQIVSGEVRSPYVIVKRLARKLSVQVAAMAEVFALNFQNRPAQAFKADGKPKLNNEPLSWRQAIEAAGIKGEEAQRLLDLEKEME